MWYSLFDVDQVRRVHGEGEELLGGAEVELLRLQDDLGQRRALHLCRGSAHMTSKLRGFYRVTQQDG